MLMATASGTFRPGVSGSDLAADDDDGDEDDTQLGAGHGVDHQADSDNSWSDSDTDSQESASASDGAWYGHGRTPASRNSSVLNLDEEISAHEQSTENMRLAAKAEAARKKRQQEQNAGMPCPPMCGVSWGINGQLVYFSNLPLLTHYLVNNQRRRRNPAAQHHDPLSDEHRLMQAEPSSHIDHEEEENSAWAGASAHANITSHSSQSTAHLDIDEVLPRTYQDLLQLPFVAAHLGYVVGEDLEEPVPRERTDGSDAPTPIAASPTPERINSVPRQWPGRVSRTQSSNNIAQSSASAVSSRPSASDLTSSSLADTAASSPTAISLPAVLDLSSVDLASVNVRSSAGQMSHVDSGTHMDQMDPYDLIDDFEVDGMSAGANTSAVAGSDDFFSSFFNSTLHLGISAVAPSSKSASQIGRSDRSVPMVPPLPSLTKPKQTDVATPRSATLTPSRSTNAVSDSPTHSSPAVNSGHSWSTLSTTVPSIIDTTNLMRRRIRINTSILIMDCQDIMPCSQRLAQEYTLSAPDSVSVCILNQRVCERAGRFDLAATWQLASIIAQPHAHASQSPLTPWSENPMGGGLAEQLIQQYLRIGDIQTVAMLVSVFRPSLRSAAPSLLPSRPPPAVVEVHELDAPLVVVLNDSSPSSLTSIATTATTVAPHEAVPLPPSAPDTPSPHPTMSMPLHPMALLPATAAGSSRTWGPGSTTARGFLAAAAAIRSNYSSGTASPNDSIYNTNQMQRAKWRGQVDDSSSASSRLRSGSFTSARTESIPRIEEGDHPPAPEMPLRSAGSFHMSTRRSTDNITPSHSVSSLHSAVPAVLQIRLDPLDVYLYLYAEYLFRIGEYSTRSMMLKYLHDSQPLVQHLITGFAVDEQVYGLAAVCAHCHTEQSNQTRPSLDQQRLAALQSVSSAADLSSMSIPPRSSSPGLSAPWPGSPRCTRCFHHPLTCSLCQVSVKGIYLMCVLCGHGGHPAHLTEWFRGASECPAACGCRCEIDGGLQRRADAGELATSHAKGKQRRKTKRELELRALEAEQQQQAAADAQQIADEEQAANEAEHSEQLEHFYNPANMAEF